VDVGSEEYLDLVPREHRDQLLVQAMVTGLRHVLYVVARAKGIIYWVLVRFDQVHIDSYEALCLRATPLFQWLYGSGTDDEVVQRIPDCGAETRAQLASAVPRFRALGRCIDRREREGQGPLPPVYAVRPAVAHFYSQLKGGVDSTSALVGTLMKKQPLDGTSFRQRVVVRMMATAFVAAFKANAIYRAHETLEATPAAAPAPASAGAPQQHAAQAPVAAPLDAPPSTAGASPPRYAAPPTPISSSSSSSTPSSSSSSFSSSSSSSTASSSSASSTAAAAAAPARTNPRTPALSAQLASHTPITATPAATPATAHAASSLRTPTPPQ